MPKYVIPKTRIYFKPIFVPHYHFILFEAMLKVIIKSVNHRIRMSDLSPEKLEVKAINRGIKSYKSMCINELLSILDASKPVKENKPIRYMEDENFMTGKII